MFVRQSARLLARVAVVSGVLGLALAPTFAAPSTPSITLTQANANAIVADLNSRLSRATTDDAKIAAVAEAAGSAFAAYGSSAAGSIASAIIAAATGKISDADLGKGLAEAALRLFETNPEGAKAIAATIANEGAHPVAEAFAAAILAAGGLKEIADIALRPPGIPPVSEIDTAPPPPQGNGVSNGAPTISPCANPSCS